MSRDVLQHVTRENTPCGFFMSEGRKPRAHLPAFVSGEINEFYDIFTEEFIYFDMK